jgi:hypothetical protein
LCEVVLGDVLVKAITHRGRRRYFGRCEFNQGIAGRSSIDVTELIRSKIGLSFGGPIDETR